MFWQILRRLYRRFTAREAVWLQLRVRWRGRLFYEWEHEMAKIGDTLSAKIAPTNSAGFAATVTDIAWTSSTPGYTVTPAADGLTASVTAVGTVTGASLGVTAKSQSGVSLTASAALPDVIDNEATNLNLTVA